MRTSTPYVATGTCAAPEKGMLLQNWATTRQWMEVERVINGDVKNQLEDSVIRPVGAYNNTFGVDINKLGLMLRKPKADQKTGRMINFVN